MATTVVASTLTVTLTEAVTLNGQNQGASTVVAIGSVGEVLKQIVNVTETKTELLKFASTAGRGQTITSTTKYVRLTNLDDSYNLVVNCIGATDDEFYYIVKPGHSFILSTVSSCMDSESGGVVSSVSLQNLSTISAWCATSAQTVDVEFFVAQS
ncbi:MAG: hypothetical protein CMB80_28660 [Flammeovirgaceae bacterium]|nr:hypothetical protein [Flammeovirgaceae bacterium]|tara:strand:+ start:442 stop:906 length:465 start_codon:yes stop_codon:yes gene_type:complete